MLPQTFFIFLTLVLNLSLKAECFAQPVASEADRSRLDEQALVITPVELGSKEKSKKDLFFPYQQSISFRLILLMELERLRRGQIPYGLGILYLLPRKSSPQLEFGLDLLSSQNGQISLGLRHIFFPDNYFRPYYKLSAAHIWRSEEKMASFVNWENYVLRLGVGFEDVIQLPMSVRLELEGGLSFKHSFILLHFGYSWSW